MKFELAKDMDKLEIMNLYKSIRETPGWNDIPNYIEDYPSMKDVENDISMHSLYCIKNDDDKVVAVATLINTNEYDLLGCFNDKIKLWCDLMRVGVSKNQQGKGIGKNLLKHIIEEAKRLNYEGIRLITAKNNNAAIALFEKFSFNYKSDIEMYGIICRAYELII